MTDIIIIGAGPAGLTAAIYALRSGKSVNVIEASQYGGQIITAANIENYPGIDAISGLDFANSLYDQAIKFGMEYINDKIIEINGTDNDFTLNGVIDTYNAKKIIIATGVQKRNLPVKESKKYLGMGLSYCATCDGAFFKNMDVVVVGGGNTAAYEAKYLSSICKSVTLIHRNNNFKCDKKILNTLEHIENVKILPNTEIESINGITTVESINCKNNIDNSIFTLTVNGIFVAIGHEASSSFIKDIIELDNEGYIITDDDCKTNIEGIYAIGDCRKKKIRQLTTATGDGAIAASIISKL